LPPALDDDCDLLADLRCDLRGDRLAIAAHPAHRDKPEADHRGKGQKDDRHVPAK
jgi:hypothetical protein